MGQFANPTEGARARRRTRKLLLLTLLLLACALALPAGAAAAGEGWFAQSSGTTADLIGVAFSDASRGWAVGAGGTILATLDGGGTWSAQVSGTTAYLRNVAVAADGLHAWVVGESYDEDTGYDAVILATTDGGTTWAQQAHYVGRKLSGVAFSDTGHGWAVGGDYLGVPGSFRGVILRTTDGGATWNEQATPEAASFFKVVSGSDGAHGWAMGSSVIFGTTNGGTTWGELGAATGALQSGIVFSDLTHGWLVGAEGALQATTDGGATWGEQASGTTTNLHAVAVCSDAAHGWAVGAGGLILATTDGATWGEQISGATADLYAVAFPDTAHGWAVGAAGTILVTTNGGVLQAPTVTGLSPTSGPWGTVVTVTGTAFGRATVVSFNGVPATDVTVASATQITVAVPAGATTGKVAVTNPAGTGASAGDFTVTPVYVYVTAPTVSSSWPSGSTQTVSWTVNPAVSIGEFRVWLVSSAGTWYIGKQVLPTAGLTSYSTSITVGVPAGSGYKAYVYWRPTVGSGTWMATARGAAFTVTPINITLPTASSSWPSGSPQYVEWTINPTVSTGEFCVWLVSSGGTWYVGKQVLSVAGQTRYLTLITANVPAASGYRAYVYWRPLVGGGAWQATAKSAAFTVTPIDITSPTAFSSSWGSGSTQTVSWTINPSVSTGEFRVWLVSSGGTWYVGKQVLPTAGLTSYSTEVTVSPPAGTGYKAYVYWRPTVGSGSWAATAQSAPFTISPLGISSPTLASRWKTGSTQTVAWTINPAVSTGEFRIWLVSMGGTWYVGKQVLPTAGRTSYSTTIGVTAPSGPGYRVYVYWRPTVGSGAWEATAQSAAFMVVTEVPSGSAR